MSAVFGLFDRSTADLRASVERMVSATGGAPDALNLNFGDVQRPFAYGYQAARCGAASNGRGVTAILSGSLLDDDGEGQQGGVAGATRVLQAYETRGLDATLSGSFNAVIVDEARSRFVLINDLVGSFPQFWHCDNGQFAFASGVRPVVAAMRAPAELDLDAVADYLHFGLVLGTRSLVAGIEMVPVGTTLAFDWSAGSLQRIVRRRPRDLFEPVEQSRDEYFERVRSAFNAAVARACQSAPALGLSLSGGLDSRAILSAVPPLAEPVRSCTVGVRSCADDVIAEKLARIAGTRHHFFELGEQYLRDFVPNLSRMIELTDGMYLSHGLTEILALKAVEDTGMQTLLRGHCGELAKARLAWPFHTDDRVASQDAPAFESYFFDRVNYISRRVEAADLFTAELRPRVAGAARKSFRERLQAAAGLSPVNLCSYVYLTEHHRRCTVQSIALFRASVDVRMPFADERFLAVLLSGRPEWRDGTDLHRFITGRNAPALLRVRNSNTGASGSAGPLIERLMDPVNSVLKKLNAPGYRHYHRFDAWMRTQLLASVEEVLFDAETINRGIFDRHKLRELVSDTQNGRADHSYLLQILLILELWQRQVRVPAYAA